MQASTPIMSAFVIYLIGLLSTVYIFKKQNRSLLYSRFTMAALFVTVALFSFSSAEETNQLRLVDASYFQANQPIGEAKGVFPGRVVWVYNPDVTNPKMTNTKDDYWAMDKNCPQIIVDSMLTSGIRRIGGKSDVKQAWNEIFKYFNKTHGKGSVGYTAGEKIAIKINLTNSSCNCAGPTRMDASPQLTLAILHQLVDVVGVSESDIWIGDSYRKFRDEYYDKCHAEYPNVHYVDGEGGNGREQTKPSSTQLLKFSDSKKSTSSIPQHYVNATYFINIPCLKTHDTAGITLGAKNHQGSVLYNGDSPNNQSAMYMHPYFPQKSPQPNSYRHLVDYMGHKDLGGKTLLYIVDGIWAGRSWEGFLEKWAMAPFNNDYPSSLFLSQDAVAIESVGFDFFLEEYASKTENQKYPYMSGVDDYMLQAADPANWPAGTNYDPEGDGIALTSLGVYEHWNNATLKQYSRNLDPTSGTGIELKKYFAFSSDPYKSELVTGGVDIEQQEDLTIRIFPNPFSDFVTIEHYQNEKILLNIYDMQGKLVFNTEFAGDFIWDARDNKGSRFHKGNYILKLHEKQSGKLLRTEKIVLI
jgi:hypothetical protein